MDERIIDFIALLRRNEVRVAMSEGIDAIRALAYADVGDREAFRAALCATLIKSRNDVEAFDSLFDLYFSGMADAIRKTLAAAGEKATASSADAILDTLRELGFEPPELMQALLKNDAGRLEQMLRAAAEQADVRSISNPFQEGYYSYKLAEQLNWYQVKYEMQQDAARLRGHGYRALADELDRLSEEFMRAFQEIIKDFVRREFEKTNHDFRRRFQEKSLLDKSFFTVSPDDLRRMEEVVRQLAEKLKSRVALRRKRNKRRGTLNLQATIRKNLANGGIPFDVAFRRKKKDKPELILLCDVSDSVRQASAFMLRFVYSVQELFSKVRSFIFVSDVGEVTQLFKEAKETGEALERAFNGEVINVWQNSNFGRVFEMFHRDYLGIVNKKTTVIILGDGRNNYNRPNDWVLRDIQAKAKKLIWLNPEGRRSWGTGDSEMPRYQRWCDVAEEVRTLNQLRRVIDGLVV